MKVALLLFGQPRFVDRSDIIESYYHYIFDRYDTTVYAQCWFDSNNQYYEPSSWALQHGAHYNIPKNAIDNIIKYYQPKKLLVEKPQTFEVSPAVKSVLDRRFSGNQYYSASNMSNIISQTLALDSACRLIYNERNSYDKIVIGRYDAVLENLPNLNELDNYSFYKPMGGHFNDLVHVMSPNFLEVGNNPFFGLSEQIMTNTVMAEMVDLPIPELFKYVNFIEKNGLGPLKSCNMYAHVIRN